MQEILTRVLATEIAVEASAAAGYDVLLTNTDGLVIGSNRTERLGSLHAPSLEVVRTGATVSRGKAQIVEEGVRPGITMPIDAGGQVIGTVGIAGPPRTVRRLGRLVQRQTQILIREAAAQRSQALREPAVAQLVRDVAIFDARYVEEQVLLSRAEGLGLQLKGNKVAVIVQVDAAASIVLARAAREAFSSRGDIVAETAVGRCTILHPVESRSGSSDGVRERCNRLIAALAERAVHRLFVGIGSVANGVAALQGSCDEAAAVVRRARRSGLPGVYHVDDLRIPLLIESVPQTERCRFVDAVLGGVMSRPDAEELRSMIEAWMASGCNLADCARRCGVHRNTVIYRLEKLRQITDIDLRVPLNAVAAYLAVVADWPAQR